MHNRVILNNEIATDFLKKIKKSKEKYKTLTKKQERELIDRLRYTDERKLRELLVLHNLKIVFNLSKKYAKNTMDFDDLIGRGLFGLTRAANLFDFDAVIRDKEKKPVLDKHGNTIPIKFITYARPWVFKYIVMEFQVKGWKVIEKSSSFDGFMTDRTGENISKDDIESFFYQDMDPSQVKRGVLPSDQIILEHDASIYTDCVDHVKYSTELSVVEKGVFMDLFVENMGEVEVSKKWKLTSARFEEIREKTVDVARRLVAVKYPEEQLAFA